MSEAYFTPKNLFTRIKLRWVLLVACMLLGAVIGYVIHLLNPELYEAHAEITFSIDYSQTGEITNVEQDVALVSAGDIIRSSTVYDLVAEYVGKQGLDPKQFVFDKNLFLERYNFRYRLVAIADKGDDALAWVSAWLIESDQLLKSARQEARLAADARFEKTTLQNCLTSNLTNQPVICKNMSVGEIAAKIQAAATTEEKAVAAARCTVGGLIPRFENAGKYVH